MAEDKKIKLLQMRGRLRELESQAEAALSNHSPLGIRLLLEAAIIAQRIVDERDPADPAREVRPLTLVDKAAIGVQKLLEHDPAYIRKNQEAIFPTLMAIRMANPEVYGEHMVWNILSNLTVDVLNDRKRAEQRGIFLEFLRDDAERSLFREIFWARDKQDHKRRALMEDMWRSCMLRLYELSGSAANLCLKDRQTRYARNPEKYAEQLALLEEMKAAFKKHDEKIRKMKQSKTLGSGDEDAIGEFRRVQRALTQPQPDQKKLAQHEVPVRRHFTAGTKESARIRHPRRMMWLLRLYKPGEPN